MRSSASRAVSSGVSGSLGFAKRFVVFFGMKRGTVQRKVGFGIELVASLIFVVVGRRRV